MEKVGQLTREQYLEWQWKLAQIEAKEAKLKAAQMQHGLILKDLELSKLKAELFKHNAIQIAELQLATLKNSYDKFVTEHSLRDVIVDEVTYEIFKDEPQENS